jgi:RNA polymerase sigma-70 factor, ECF subfamily
MRHQTTTEKALGTPNTDRRWGVEQSTVRVSEASAIEGPAVDERDIAVFEEMVGRCEDRAYRLAMQLVRSEPAAQEILQRAFLSAWQNRRRLVGDIEFSRWVCRTVGKAALGHLNAAVCRSQASSGDRLASIRTSPTFWIRPMADKESDWAARPGDQLCAEDLHRHIRKTVDGLPTELRVMFVLCDSEAMPVEDAAQILDLPVAAAREYLQAARLAMRAAIADYFLCSDVSDGTCGAAPVGIDGHVWSEASFTDP